MKVDLNKTDLIRLVKGSSPKIDTAIKLEKIGLMRFCGNQHNPEWGWTVKIYDMNEEELWALYKSLINAECIFVRKEA
ncbi:MAG: hypothetical protein ACRC7I_13250 [Selenomonadaceae bacterium]